MEQAQSEVKPMVGSGANAGASHGGGASRASAAYEAGFHSFPVSLPFAPFGILNEHQKAFYEGWIAAAYAVFGNFDPKQPEAH